MQNGGVGDKELAQSFGRLDHPRLPAVMTASRASGLVEQAVLGAQRAGRASWAPRRARLQCRADARLLVVAVPHGSDGCCDDTLAGDHLPRRSMLGRQVDSTRHPSRAATLRTRAHGVLSGRTTSG